MANALPTLLVTGASGTVGRHFLATAAESFHVTAVARRSQAQAGIPYHPNVHWLQVDIGNPSAVRGLTRHLQRRGGVEFVLHLAAYYDFEYREHPEYQRTNVNGTRYLLGLAAEVGVKRFIFASSIAACPFPGSGSPPVTEATAPDAGYPYARSKQQGESLMREFADRVPGSIVRLAAVFSDWGEFPPLYVLLSSWLSRAWSARFLGGRGESAIPYIHTRDLTRIFLIILRRWRDLPPAGTYLASPDGATSHRELFEMATRFYFGDDVRPIPIPGPLAACAVRARGWLGRASGRRPFERPWMIRYLDRKLEVDAGRTRQELGWSPTPRYHILRRVLFMVEKLKNHPDEWAYRNELAMRRPPVRPALVIHDALVADKEEVTERIVAAMRDPDQADRFPHYQRMTEEELRSYVRIAYELTLAAVRTGDRTLLLNYLGELARRRFERGFPPSEVCQALRVIHEMMVKGLATRPSLDRFRESIHDLLTLTMRLAEDGVEDAYEELALAAAHKGPVPVAAGAPAREMDLERVIQELNAVYILPPRE